MLPFLLSGAGIGFGFAALALFIRWRLPDRTWSILPLAAAAAVLAIAFVAGFEQVWSRMVRPADFHDLRNTVRVVFGLAFAVTTLSIHRRASWVERDLLIESLVGTCTFVLCLLLAMMAAVFSLSGAVLA
jgi:hypothetical protein